ncbi:aminodeoxychorismate lyase [Vibrio genomosp. F6]|uniref:Aminodeoxychorismate lyase n=1 Tax=Vibrio genomosp. F6 str. FF-238 TaxID=1191298 RepID=A0A1E5D8L3_9VIBR|nr:aminodeoxychorismate lyase [Vibrio genomosp. F6]OEE80046.1 aminodeoxychorismate lyase [Vibrio genomosp. F6 str. FF-238]
MYWVNGQPSDSISLSDRSFQYGDGCFTTMLTLNGEIQYWPKHIQRMNRSLDALQIPRPDWDLIFIWLEQASQKVSKAGLKLHISRGQGGRGYSPNNISPITVTISDFSFPESYDLFSQSGIGLTVCEHRLGLNPYLAGHKHNNRLEQILMKSEVEQRGFVDGVAMDINGYVIETTMANLFWAKDNVLYSPSLANCGVAGVIREQILESAKRNEIETKIGHFELTRLYDADEIFITNSILGVAPVTQISFSSDQHQAYSIGTMTTIFQETINS